MPTTAAPEQLTATIEAAVSAIPTATLLVKAYELTHAMHRARDKGQTSREAALRADRDLVSAEIERRAGGAA